LGRQIKNYDGIVWTEFKTKILEEGIKSLLLYNENIHDKFINTVGDIFIFESRYENWGVDIV
ncbi:MAG: hypothetical protein AAF673_06215, partial [Pseudomonadota bacterium]